MRPGRAADLAWILRNEPDPEMGAAWRWLFDHTEEYPDDAHTRPLARPIRGGRSRAFRVAALRVARAADGEPMGASALCLHGGEAAQTTPLVGGLADAEAVARALFAARARGSLTGFCAGARWALHLILRWYASAWTTLGYRILPIVAGSEIRALKVSKGRQAWWLCDLAQMAGEDDARPESLWDAAGDVGGADLARLSGAYHRLLTIAQLAHGRFEVGLRPTIGGTALAAFRNCLEPGFAKFRPPAPLRAMLRHGRGYRGGYLYARRHAGPTWQIDLSRAYASAMLDSLPQRVALTRWHGRSDEQGFWMCRVEGPGELPIYLAPWSTERRRFDPARAWAGGSCVAILCGAELDGIRRLGYHIWPRVGYGHFWSWHADAFVDKLSSILREFGRGSVEDRWAKRLAVAAYGRLAMREERDSVCYSADPPPGGWYPYLTPDGEVIDGLWARPERVYTPGQQVDLAATLAARVRGRVYSTAADLVAAGVGVVAADTDSLTLSGDPAQLLELDGDTIGAWRLKASDPAGMVAGARLSHIAGKTIAAGLSGADGVAVEAVMRGEDVKFAGHLLHLPWLREQMVTTVVRERKARWASRSSS